MLIDIICFLLFQASSNRRSCCDPGTVARRRSFPNY